MRNSSQNRRKNPGRKRFIRKQRDRDLLALVLAFSMIVTTLATILPARRAARIDPITALRHD